MIDDSARLERPAFIRHSRTRELTLAALITAMLSASAWIAIPAGAVPVTLQVFVVLLAALLLRPATATAALAAYVLLGAVGIPVFSGGQGGIGVLAGPTGGYLVGFILAAALGSATRRALERRGSQIAADACAVLVGIVLIYAIGWAWLATVTGMNAGAAFAAGVVPFVVADAIKGVVAFGIAKAVRRSGVI